MENYLKMIAGLALLSFSTTFCPQDAKAGGFPSNISQQPAQKAVASKTLRIDTFSTFPPEIDGCSCYFSATAKELKSSTYLYADDYQKTAFVRINGVMTKFQLKETKTLAGKHTIKKFTNKAFDLVIDIKQTGQIDETWQQKGTLKLTSKDGKTVLKNIVGECGC